MGVRLKSYTTGAASDWPEDNRIRRQFNPSSNLTPAERTIAGTKIARSFRNIWLAGRNLSYCPLNTGGHIGYTLIYLSLEFVA